MKFKKLAVVMMAVLVFASSMFVEVKPSKAAEDVEVIEVIQEKEKKEKSYTKAELRQMAAIIFCEAGNQSYAGKLAVGVVVMNRKKSSAFPNTVKGVLKQRCQFTPVATGKWAAEMKLYKKGAYKSGARKQCLKAAKAALKGENQVKYRGKKINMKRYHFFSQRLSRARLRIGGHDFK